MTRIRFVSESGALLNESDAMPGDNLLDVARLADVPLHWRCGQGTCGTCKVRIAGMAAPQWPGRKERNVLQRAGAIGAELAACEEWREAEPWRLACHLAVEEESWVVRCPDY
ncbi:2Fe-2S iron-sulfur cluster-binding protein [Chromobacterium violaceum]|uniref:2Fe-2S iron-sulfur cluster binding domain n=1 Tax=Chromobacterium violaceum TaxID=536 RepID=A0AAX2M9D0_CHRVL|nr:2Fe-2S iron-sulfur cluster-binding protein [Chromobacterium violaceum]STB63708.1 2Fe-2S iron-sulfur cluster binding domain [Chromobacterium violaceum]SUX32506.1 2Fe-2S iron-sulfur cluster binding domain [Chromobacterium violaceum]